MLTQDPYMNCNCKMHKMSDYFFVWKFVVVFWRSEHISTQRNVNVAQWIVWIFNIVHGGGATHRYLAKTIKPKAITTYGILKKGRIPRTHDACNTFAAATDTVILRGPFQTSQHFLFRYMYKPPCFTLIHTI